MAAEDLSIGIDVAAQALKLLVRLVGGQTNGQTEKKGARKKKARPPVPKTETIEVPKGRHKIGHFSTRNKAFYDHLWEVRSLILDYAARRSASKPLNLLMSAPPGSGKSFLVKQMLAHKDANSLTIPYLELNISNIVGREDLVAAWSFIRTMKANHITPCVFFDEIDTPIGKEYLLKDLIMPMNDAAVIQGGDKLELGPAIFIFAGSKLFEPLPVVGQPNDGEGASIKFSDWLTDRERRIRGLGSPPPPGGVEPISAAELPSAHSVPKVRDFLDRIDRFIIFPDAKAKFEGMDEEVMENEAVDLVLSMIGKHFPTLKSVEVAAAAALAASLRAKSASKRSAERLVFTSIVPSAAEVFKFSNLASDAQRLLTAKELDDLKTKFGDKAFKID